MASTEVSTQPQSESSALSPSKERNKSYDTVEAGEGAGQPSSSMFSCCLGGGGGGGGGGSQAGGDTSQYSWDKESDVNPEVGMAVHHCAACAGVQPHSQVNPSYPACCRYVTMVTASQPANYLQ